MDGDEALEDDGPGGIAHAVLQGAEDLGNASLAGMGRDEEMLDVFRLRRSILLKQRKTAGSAEGGREGGRTGEEEEGMDRAGGTLGLEARVAHLDFGRALDGLFERARHDGRA